MPNVEDRISIRQQQIEELRDLIAWEEMHDWGEASELKPMSHRLIEHYAKAISTLEAIVLMLALRTSDAQDTAPH